MTQIAVGVPAQRSPFHAPAAATTVADLLHPPLSTVGQFDHVAAATYLMRQAGTTALIVVHAQTGQPVGLITQADVARAIAAGNNVNDVRVKAVMTSRPAITATTGVSDAAKIMTAGPYRHLPVIGEAGLLGVVDLTDVCRALTGEDPIRRQRAQHTRRFRAASAGGAAAAWEGRATHRYGAPIQ